MTCVCPGELCAGPNHSGAPIEIDPLSAPVSVLAGQRRAVGRGCGVFPDYSVLGGCFVEGANSQEYFNYEWSVQVLII